MGDEQGQSLREMTVSTSSSRQSRKMAEFRSPNTEETWSSSPQFTPTNSFSAWRQALASFQAAQLETKEFFQERRSRHLQGRGAGKAGAQGQIAHDLHLERAQRKPLLPKDIDHPQHIVSPGSPPSGG